MGVLVDGAGNWSGWQGRGLWVAGGHRIADLALRQDKGRYRLAGRLTLGSIAKGKAQRLTAPSVLVSGEARYEDRRLDGSLKLASPEAAVIARGAIDLAHGAYDPLKVDALLLQPSALFPNMTGHDIRIHAELDGPFKSARFRYDATSPQFAFDKTGFEVVRAEGAGHVGGKDLALPIRLTARRDRKSVV